MPFTIGSPLKRRRFRDIANLSLTFQGHVTSLVT